MNSTPKPSKKSEAEEKVEKEEENYVEIVKESVLKRSRSFMCNETVQMIDTHTSKQTHTSTLDNTNENGRMQALC